MIERGGAVIATALKKVRDLWKKNCRGVAVLFDPINETYYAENLDQITREPWSDQELGVPLASAYFSGRDV